MYSAPGNGPPGIWRAQHGFGEEDRWGLPAVVRTYGVSTWKVSTSVN